MNKPSAKSVAISHFSDALCIWAYISQIRIAELQANFPGQVELNYHFLQVFGDVAGKMAQQWADAVIRAAGLDADGVRMTLDTGLAHAGLSADLAAAAHAFVRSSPTLTFNEGRQVLAGNVSYRVLEANIRELLQRPGDLQSWC